jgi:hypothetical protein
VNSATIYPESFFNLKQFRRVIRDTGFEDAMDATDLLDLGE